VFEKVPPPRGGSKFVPPDSPKSPTRNVRRPKVFGRVEPPHMVPRPLNALWGLGPGGSQRPQNFFGLPDLLRETPFTRIQSFFGGFIRRVSLLKFGYMFAHFPQSGYPNPKKFGIINRFLRRGLGP